MKFIFLINIFFLSCSTQNSKDASVKNVMQVDSLKIKLQGQWGGLEEDSPVLEITYDSIYYFEEKKSYSYQIIGKDLVIHRTQSVGVLRNISVLKDTMTFCDDQEFSIKAYRFKIRK